jgi:hypothetical protein
VAIEAFNVCGNYDVLVFSCYILLWLHGRKRGRTLFWLLYSHTDYMAAKKMAPYRFGFLLLPVIIVILMAKAREKVY